MKKIWKGLTAAAVAAAMGAVGFVGASSAMAVPVEVKLPNGVSSPTLENNTFKVYQVFAAEATNEDGKLVLTNISGWGSGVNGTALLNALKTLTIDGKTPFADCKSAADVAKVLDGQTKDSALAKAFAKAVANNKGTEYSGEKLPMGYYVVIDETNNVENGGTTNNFPVLFPNATADLEKIMIDLKTDIPTVEKKVFEGENGQPASCCRCGQVERCR